MNANEAARLEGIRGNIADEYNNAPDAISRRNTGIDALIRGYLPESFANIIQSQYKADMPQPTTMDLGGQLVREMYDPVTGKFTNRELLDKTLTPQQVKAGEQWDKTFAENHNRAEIERADRRIDADREYNLKKQQADRTYALSRQPKLVNTTRGDDGLLYKVFSDGTQQRLNPDEVGFSTIEKENVARLETRRKALVDQYNALVKARTDVLKNISGGVASALREDGQAPTSPELESINFQISDISRQIKDIDDDIDKIYTSKLQSKQGQPTQSTDTQTKAQLGTGLDIGANMISHKHNGWISAPFGQTRKRKDGTPYKHKGTDYAVPSGTQILTPDVGTPLYVARIGKDPDGYGNYVVLEGNLHGHKIELLMGHMADGIKLKRGDRLLAGNVIGLSGNTGNSRGKNGGYHMHLETKLDGEYIDPQKFIGKITPHITKKRDDVAYTNSNGKMITTTEYEALRKSIQEGKSPNGIGTLQDLDEALRREGYKPIGQTSSPSPQSTTTSEQDMAAVLREARAGMPQYDISNAELSASLPSSGVVPRGATRIDPDGGLTQYRAEGDNSPVAWRNSSGAPMRTSDGQLFTQQMYEDWARRADAGEYRNRNINSRADLDKWLEKVGMRRETPSEQRGLNNLNGNSNANVPAESEDTNVMPFNVTPQTHPEQYPAPEFTDTLNGTTPSDTDELLNGLNGITDSRYSSWTEALRRYYPETLSNTSDIINMPDSSVPAFSNSTPKSMQQDAQSVNEDLAPPLSPEDYDLDYDLSDAELVAGRSGGVRKGARLVRKRRRVAPQQPVPAPKAGRTSYEQQRTHVDNAAKTHGIDNELIRAVIQVESGWNPNARSKVGAMGLMQLMPETAKSLGVSNAYDPAQNIAGGSKYIAQLVKKYKGDVSKALMAYNCGPGNVKRGRIPKSSKAYAKKVMGIYRALKGQQ